MTTHRMSLATLAAAALVLACQPDRAPLGPTERPEAAAGRTSDLFLTTNATGRMGTVSTTGTIDAGNAFFRSLGTNGRSCGSCHLEASAFGLSAQAAQAVFAATGGTDPLFAPVDGANCPSVTPADGAAGHSLLLNHGLIRVNLAIPAGAEYGISAVHDPYGCALTGSPVEASVYRRVLPTTNLRFLSAVMWDGRETVQPLTDRRTFVANLRAAYDRWWNEVQPLLVNEGATGPQINPFKALYYKQFGGQPDAALLKIMDPAGRANRLRGRRQRQERCGQRQGDEPGAAGTARSVGTRGHRIEGHRRPPGWVRTRRTPPG